MYISFLKCLNKLGIVVNIGKNFNENLEVFLVFECK